MKSTGKIITAVAAGAAVGAILGVLFAPDKGSETRKKINKQGKDIADGFKEEFEKGKAKINGMKDDLMKTVKEGIEEFA